MTPCRNLSIFGPLMGIFMLLALPAPVPAGDLDSPSAPEATLYNATGGKSFWGPAGLVLPKGAN